MKFPHNTDAWANHLAMLATCADQRDASLMLTFTRRASEFSPVGRMKHDHRESVAVLRLQERLAGVRK